MSRKTTVLSVPILRRPNAFVSLKSIVSVGVVTCPHCGNVGGRVYDLPGVRSKSSGKNPQGILRHDFKKSAECRQQFIVKVCNVIEHALVPMHRMFAGDARCAVFPARLARVELSRERP